MSTQEITLDQKTFSFILIYEEGSEEWYLLVTALEDGESWQLSMGADRATDILYRARYDSEVGKTLRGLIKLLPSKASSMVFRF